MNKATPIPDTIESRASGSYQTASCRPCGGPITRSKVIGTDRYLHWWHINTSLVYCGEEKD